MGAQYLQPAGYYRPIQPTALTEDLGQNRQRNRSGLLQCHRPKVKETELVILTEGFPSNKLNTLFYADNILHLTQLGNNVDK